MRCWRPSAQEVAACKCEVLQLAVCASGDSSRVPAALDCRRWQFAPNGALAPEVPRCAHTDRYSECEEYGEKGLSSQAEGSVLILPLFPVPARSVGGCVEGRKQASGRALRLAGRLAGWQAG